MASQDFDGSFDGVVTLCQNLFLGIKSRNMNLRFLHSLLGTIFISLGVVILLYLLFSYFKNFCAYRVRNY